MTKTNNLIETQRQQKEISLNEKQRRQEKKDLENIQIELENNRRKALGKELISSLDELDNAIGEDDEDKAIEEDKDKKKDGPTPLLTETGNILIDFLNLAQPKLAEHN